MQFSDARRVQQLFSSDWPLTTITDNSNADGNEGAEWNYGSNFGGGSKYSTDHDIFGEFGVTDSVYEDGEIVLCTDATAPCSG